MTTQKTTFESKPYSALFINGPYESRNVGIKLYFRYQLFFLSISHGITPLEGGGVAVSPAEQYLKNTYKTYSVTNVNFYAHFIGRFLKEKPC
jgi:hypothetical protein